MLVFVWQGTGPLDYAQFFQVRVRRANMTGDRFERLLGTVKLGFIATPLEQGAAGLGPEASLGATLLETTGRTAFRVALAADRAKTTKLLTADPLISAAKLLSAVGADPALVAHQVAARLHTRAASISGTGSNLLGLARSVTHLLEASGLLANVRGVPKAAEIRTPAPAVDGAVFDVTLVWDARKARELRNEKPEVPASWAIRAVVDPVYEVGEARLDRFSAAGWWADAWARCTSGIVGRSLDAGPFAAMRAVGDLPDAGTDWAVSLSMYGWGQIASSYLVSFGWSQDIDDDVPLAL